MAALRKRGCSTSSYRAMDEPEMNLTPLIDVVFCILIMFIVLAPVLEIDHIALASAGSGPSPSLQELEGNPEISIYVLRDNSVLLNSQKIALSLVEERLRQEKLSHPTATPKLFHDKEAAFGTYQSIKNAAELAGFDQLDVVLCPNDVFSN